MDIDGMVKSVETYLRQFIIFLASFFYPRSRNQEYDDANNTAVFAILSAGFGAYLWNHYITHDSATGADLFGVVVDSLLRWFSLGVVLYAMLAVLQVEATFMHTVLGTMKVIAIAHIVAIYLGYLITSALWVFFRDLSANFAAGTAYIFELIFVVLYIPREALPRPYHKTPMWKLVIACLVFYAIFTMLVAMPYVIRNKCYDFYRTNYPAYWAGKMKPEDAPDICQGMIKKLQGKQGPAPAAEPSVVAPAEK